MEPIKLKRLKYENIQATPEEKKGISNMLLEITKGAPHPSLGKAWLLWITCTMRDKTDEQMKTSLLQGYSNKMGGFIQWLANIMKEPEKAPEIIYSVTIGTQGTFAHVIFNDGQTMTWQVSDAPEEIAIYPFSGWDIQGFAQGFSKGPAK